MIKSRLTLKQLEAFAYVVDTGTFRAAASALGTTQPNISSRIAALETALDTPLLHRDAGPVRLTVKGAELLEKTREILRAGEALLETADRRDLIDERLRLGVTELVAATWLQPFLRLLRQEYPSLRVELTVDLTNEIDGQLRGAQLDLALHNAPFTSPASGEQALASEPYIWVANPDIAARLSAGDAVARFFDHPVLTHARHTVAAQALHDLASSNDFDTGKIVHSSALTACVPMAREGLGIAHLPAALILDDIDAGHLVALAADWNAPPLTFFARYDRDRAPRYVARACALAAELRPPA